MNFGVNHPPKVIVEKCWKWFCGQWNAQRKGLHSFYPFAPRCGSLDLSEPESLWGGNSLLMAGKNGTPLCFVTCVLFYFKFIVLTLQAINVTDLPRILFTAFYSFTFLAPALRKASSIVKLSQFQQNFAMKWACRRKESSVQIHQMPNPLVQCA